MSEREATGSQGPCQSTRDAWARTALDALPEAVLVCDADGSLWFANGAAIELLGEGVACGMRLPAALASGAPLAQLATDACRTGTARSACVRPDPGERGLLVRAAPLDTTPPACLLTLRERTGDDRQERDLWQAEKMAALGRLAASVAHEVRNPLGAVDIQLQLLAEDARKLADAERTRLLERVDRARTEMRRLDGIVHNFLRFSRPPAVRLEPTDPRQLVQRVHDLVAPEARARRIELGLDPAAPVPCVRADENVLSQALLNVLINAFQAVDGLADGARVDLRCRAADRGEEVRIEVTDNGCGIPTGDLERVLEYYYTTKDTGTGLGLSIAQGILQQHGGSLHLTSRVGLGTTVTLELPACGPASP